MFGALPISNFCDGHHDHDHDAESNTIVRGSATAVNHVLQTFRGLVAAASNPSCKARFGAIWKPDVAPTRKSVVILTVLTIHIPFAILPVVFVSYKYALRPI